jgi:predicted deacylase
VLHAYEGVKNLMRFYGHLQEPVKRIDPVRAHGPRVVSALNLEAYVPAPRDGIWEPSVELGESVEQGAPIGFLHDFTDYQGRPLEVRANRSGVLIMMHSPATCHRGVTLYVIAQDV